jgi:hypothetical protein
MYWLQQLLASAVIALAILLLSLLPARHVLLPLWPRQVDEFVMIEDSQASSIRALVMAGQELDPDRVLVRTRPLSVAAVESLDGRTTLGYPVGLRSAEADEDTQDRPLPIAFRLSALHSMPLGEDALLLMDANDQLQVIPLSEIRRLYYPNRLNPLERVAFVARRVRAAFPGPGAPSPVSSEPPLATGLD